jgi:hypothetical protein
MPATILQIPVHSGCAFFKMWMQIDNDFPSASRMQPLQMQIGVLSRISALQAGSLFILGLPGAEEEQDCAEARCQQDTPSAGNDFTGVRSISRPGQRFAPRTAENKSQKI